MPGGTAAAVQAARDQYGGRAWSRSAVIAPPAWRRSPPPPPTTTCGPPWGCTRTTQPRASRRSSTCSINPGVVAVGEAGLDYYYEHSPRDVQRQAFAQQVQLAHQLGLPLIIHSRDAWDDTFDVLTAEGTPEHTVFHCFTGGAAEARRCLELGAFVSFSGIVTFKSATDVQEAASLVPLDRMLIETDAPYLAPIPHRGKPNQPAYVALTAQFIADLRDDTDRHGRLGHHRQCGCRIPRCDRAAGPLVGNRRRPTTLSSTTRRYPDSPVGIDLPRGDHRSGAEWSTTSVTHMNQDFAQRRRVALALAITVIAVPAAFLLNRNGDDSAAPLGTVIGSVVADQTRADPQPADGADRCHRIPTPWARPRSDSSTARCHLRMATRQRSQFRDCRSRSMAPVRSTARSKRPSGAAAKGIPFNSRITVTNRDNSRSVSCINNVGGYAAERRRGPQR